MKELTKYSRVAGYLEKLYDKLNQDFFDGVLIRPVITIQSTSRAYGHYTLYDAWSIKGEGYREINIGAGTLDRPIENVAATLVHEMTHQYNNEIANAQDTSRSSSYHNRFFRIAAEAHGLHVFRSEKYGWSITEPSDRLIEWLADNGYTDIPMAREEATAPRTAGGNKAAQGGVSVPGVTAKPKNRRWVCPGCGAIVRSTKTVRLICGDCLKPFYETL